ncbi:hypothetical protein QBC46DRAFT_410323 [Diplogelasinospora grovesii]|uniref:Uncharacterized protein n=1 Tax=Diplogelasinospora grovesii TaxID=303347 RepID=A0AAN6N307_9PEZI|nr:hypothetical protein QBC46DRAFT_410323 [Diplogelasinospora grovesii]
MAAALDEVKQRAEERGRIAIKQREELLRELEQVSQQNAELKSRNAELESRNAELESRNAELEPGHIQDVTKPETSRRKLGCLGPQAQKGPIPNQKVQNRGHERNDRSLNETGPKSAKKRVETHVRENLEWFESINKYRENWKAIENFNPKPVKSGELNDVKEENVREFFHTALSTTNSSTRERRKALENEISRWKDVYTRVGITTRNVRGAIRDIQRTLQELKGLVV